MSEPIESRVRLELVETVRDAEGWTGCRVMPVSCANCKHARESGWVSLTQSLACGRISDDDPRAGISQQGCDSAELSVSPDFGCVLWEAK